MAPGGSGPRPPGITTWLRGARCTDPEEMPEKEARPPAQNRHGGAPRGERVPLDARRASLGTARRAPKRATTGILRLSALRSPLLGWMEKRKSKTRARKRAAGTREAGLLDVVRHKLPRAHPTSRLILRRRRSRRLEGWAARAVALMLRDAAQRSQACAGSKNVPTLRGSST